ncbi:polysaccharide pyruvyl transferase family protein [Halopseudomonas sp.]|uniref:polysaccharide pyruvyl transferase family protein n=1 Tax=Halopseudomonas sp. TaxID=2901191 RepID=UPI003002773F
MIIEIRKAGFVNKGAELMLYAVLDKIREHYPSATFTMAPSYREGSEHFHKMTRLGFYPKASFWQFGVQWGNLAAFMPKSIRDMCGLVLDRDVDIVLDAAGFAYSDQTSIKNSKELAHSSLRWKKNGTRTILLPQAFGPFEKNETKELVKKWASRVDLIFAREPESYKYLTDLVGEQKKIKLYPDFTNLLQGVLPISYDASDKRIALVPNYRMVDRTNKQESEAYLPFMIRCAKYLVEKEAQPFVVVHEGENDRILAEKISEAAGGIPIVTETDPLHIKGILGSCDATIGSRFHGLVSALSQGIPSLGTGWSHKYLRLFENYDFKEGIVSVLDSDAVLEKKIDLLINPESADKTRRKLEDISKQQKKLSEEMWSIVFAEMDKVSRKK